MQNIKISIHKDGKSAVEISAFPNRKEDEVILNVKACGICGSDIPRIFSNHAYYYPIVIGHEFSGVVTDSEGGLLNGKRVGVFPIIPCGECAFCKQGLYANCTNYNYYGSRCDGGLQEYIAIKTQNLVVLPDNVSYEVGAMLEPVSVCLHAVKKATIQKGEDVLIYGAGTIGLLCAMWAKDFGAKNIYLVDIDEKKLDFAENLGFSRYKGQQIQVVFECSGAGSCLNEAIERIDAFGRMVLVGNANLDMLVKVDNYAKVLRKQLTIMGSWNSDFSFKVNDWKESVQAISEGRIQPDALITHVLPLRDWGKVIDLIKNREFFNKIMVVNK